MDSDTWMLNLWTRALRPPNSCSQFPPQSSEPECLGERPRTRYVSSDPQGIQIHSKVWELTLTFYIKVDQLSSGSHSELVATMGLGSSSLPLELLPP